MGKKKIVIIGAGITGLSAGTYALMNGFDVEIYESHKIAGGFCTGWKRKDYTIEGCIHWLTGSTDKSPFHKFWKEIGAFEDIEFIDYEIFKKFTGKNGEVFNLYSDVDVLEKHMLELSPVDAKYSKILCDAIRALSKMKMNLDKPVELHTFKDKFAQVLSFLPHGSTFAKLGRYSSKEFADNFQHDLIRKVITNFPHPEGSILNLAFTMAELNRKSGGYPIGGSLKFIDSIEKRFRGLGGKIFFKSRVTKLNKENGYINSITLEGGEVVKGDYIVSSGDLYNTLHNLLDGKYLIPEHTDLFKNNRIVPTVVQVNLGVNYDLSAEDKYLTWEFETSKKVSIGDQEYDTLHCRNFVRDNTLAPEGKTVIQVDFLTTSFDYWKDLYKDQKSYKQVKEEILKNTVDELELKLPGIRESIEVTDVVTPYTYFRYTSSYEGNFMTWLMEKGNQKQINNIPKTIDGLNNFYLAGQWVEAVGGLPVAIRSGRDVIQLICHNEGRSFMTC